MAEQNQGTPPVAQVLGPSSAPAPASVAPQSPGVAPAAAAQSPNAGQGYVVPAPIEMIQMGQDGGIYFVPSLRPDEK
jgi:hypothetical protein